MSAGKASDMDVGFAEARRFQLGLGLALTPAERLRELEAMLDFNDMVEARNPSIRWVAERLRTWRERRWVAPGTRSGTD
jgi:hypothetical protein